MMIDLIQSNIINCETYSNFIIKHEEQYMYQTNELLTTFILSADHTGF